MTSITDNRKVDVGTIEAAKNRCLERLKTDPLAIVPINFACTAIGIKDPIQVATEFVPDKEDIGIIIVSVIGCVPAIGPLLQGAFTIFWRRASPNDSVTKEELNKAISDLRKEIMSIINDKIKTSEIEMWKSMIQSLLEGLAETSRILNDNFTKLKYKLLSNEEVSDDFTDDLRTKIDILNDKVLSLIAFCSNEKYSIYVVPYLLQSLFVYVLLMRTIDAYWYQFEIDEIHVVGRPENKELGLDAIPSYRELLHDVIVKNLKKISGMGILNPKDVENLPQLLKSDIITYPIPLIVYEGSGQTINVPDHKGKFILRIDGYNTQDTSGFTNESILPAKDFITGCKGAWINSENKLYVNTERGFKIRIYASLCNNMLHAHEGKSEALKSLMVCHGLKLDLQEEIGYVPEPTRDFNPIMHAKFNDKLVSGWFFSSCPLFENYIEISTIADHVYGVIHCVELIFG